MFMSHNQNVGQNYNINIANESFKNVANQYFIHTEIKNRLNSGMLAAIQLGVFCLPVTYLKTKRLKYSKL
jgi:hypothetical protein